MTRWLILIVLTALVTAGVEQLGVASAALFAGLLVAAVLALTGLAPHTDGKKSSDRQPLPVPFGIAAQGVLGVYIGTMVRPDTLGGLGSQWWPILVMGLGTLALSVAGGALLGLHRRVDSLTGSLALVAGGASGLVALTRELGGDERMVAVIQYIRVALVTATIPVIATLVFGVHTGAASGPQPHGNPWWGILLTFACVGIGIPLARVARLPAGGLLGPLVISMICELTHLSASAAVPPVVVTVAYAIIGWQAGLGFTMTSLGAIGKVLPHAVFLILMIGVSCAGLGVLLSWWTGESQFDGYLATTPGGIYAVLAAAASAGGNVTFVIGAQIVRVLLMLFIAPFAARAYTSRIRQAATPEPVPASPPNP